MFYTIKTYAVLSRRVRQPGSPVIILSSRLCTRLRIKGVGTSKSPYELNLDLIVLDGLGLSSPCCSGEVPGNWIVLVELCGAGPSTDTGAVTGKSIGDLDPGAVGELSLLKVLGRFSGSLSSSVRPRRNGAGFSRTGSQECSSCIWYPGVIGREPHPLSSDPETGLLVSAIE